MFYKVLANAAIDDASIKFELVNETIYDQIEDSGNVSTNPSFMSLDADNPTLAHRALVYIIHLDNAKGWQPDSLQTYYPKKNAMYSMPEH